MAKQADVYTLTGTLLLRNMKMNELKEELFQLLKKFCYRRGTFTLSSGKLSEFYMNCKPITLSGRGLTLASMLLLEHIKTNHVGGLTLGADPLVSGVAVVSALDNRIINAMIVRKKCKDHGSQQRVEGLEAPSGTEVTILEDVVTTGESSMEAARRIRDKGYQVKRVVTIVDRQEDGEATAAMEKIGLELVSLYTLKEFID